MNLCSCLRTAEEWGLLELVPRFRFLKVPAVSFDYLTEEELQVVISHASEPWASVVIVAARTGVRYGELSALTPTDVRFDTGVSSIEITKTYAMGVIGPPKNNRVRAVPLVPEAASSLARAINGKSSESSIFTWKGKPITYNAAKYHLHATCRRAGFRRIGWHTFRHTFASHLVQRGAPIVAVRDLLGHADIKTTMRYAHLRPETLVGAIQLLEKT